MSLVKLYPAISKTAALPAKNNLLRKLRVPVLATTIALSGAFANKIQAKEPEKYYNPIYSNYMAYGLYGCAPFKLQPRGESDPTVDKPKENAPAKEKADSDFLGNLWELNNNADLTHLLNNTEILKSLIMDFLDSGMDISEKIDYMTRTKTSFDNYIRSFTGDAGFLSKMFDRAIVLSNKILGHGDSYEKEMLASSLCQIIRTYISTAEQLTLLDKKNDECTKDFSDYMHGIKYLPVIDLRNNNLNKDDFYGNGYFDNYAKQKTGNCWAHGCLNNMLSNDAGRQYLNNLVVKSHGKISVYLPGAKDKNEPQPAGDGIYTYTEQEISKYYNRESMGDGDYTCFMMAITEYRRKHPDIDSQGNVYNKSSGGHYENFINLVFGEDLKKEMPETEVINLNYKNAYYLTYYDLWNNYSNDSIVYDKEKRTELRMKLMHEKIQQRYERFVELYRKNDGFFSTSINYVPTDIDGNFLRTKVPVQIPGEKEPQFLPFMTNHAYSILEVRDDCIIMQESNHPSYKFMVTPKQFITEFQIIHIPYPKSIM